MDDTERKILSEQETMDFLSRYHLELIPLRDFEDDQYVIQNSIEKLITSRSNGYQISPYQMKDYLVLIKPRRQ